MTDKKTNRKQLIGQVISSSMDKTVVVKVEVEEVEQASPRILNNIANAIGYILS